MNIHEQIADARKGAEIWVEVNAPCAMEAADDYVKAVAGDFVASPTECARTFKNRLAKLEEQT